MKPSSILLFEGRTGDAMVPVGSLDPRCLADRATRALSRRADAAVTGRGEPADGVEPLATTVEVLPADRRRWRDAWTRAAIDGETVEVEVRLAPAGREDEAAWYLVRGWPVVDEPGGERRWVGVGVDIDATRRHAAGTGSEDRILATISDVLRAPLAPILLAVHEAQRAAALSAELRANLAMIRRNVEMEARLIDDLIDASRILRSEVDYQWTAIDAQDVLARALALLAPRIAEAGVSLRLDFTAEARRVRADPARLQQVLRQLLDNALKFTPAGGRLSVRVRNADGADGRTRRLLIEVEDNGRGIEADRLAAIFLPFRRGDAGTAHAFGAGLGLGLAVGRAVAEAHAGTLRAESPGVGRGTTFILDLPTLANDGATVNGQGKPPEGRGAALRILLVEDDRHTLELTARLLRRRGHRVTPAADVATAWEAAEAEEFDLVVSDLGLPDGSGLDLMPRLRERHGLPGIAVTAFGLDRDRQRTREAGFAVHLTKPIDFPLLEEAIRRVTADPAGALRERFAC